MTTMHPIQRFFVMMLLVVVLMTGARTVFAQQAADPAATDTPDVPPVRFESPYQPYDRSLIFDETEMLQIRTALAGINSEVIENLGDPDVEAEIEVEEAAPKNRLIRLSGIAYSSPDRWMIWINGQRVTPDTLLPEIVEIDVQDGYIDLHWFDRVVKKIIKIRLRPNQVYDISTGILIPG